MRPEHVAEARRQVLNRLGEAIERKASDEFCLAVADPVFRRDGGVFEFLLQPEPTTVPTILELATRDQPLGRRSRQLPGTAEAAAREQTMHAAPLARAGAPNLSFRAERALRDAKIRDLREQRWKDDADLYEALERVMSGPLRPRPEIFGSAQTPSAMTDYCWLNQSIRTWAEPIYVADVGDDPKVERIDVSRRLVSEVSRTADVVEARAYRSKTSTTGAGVVIGVLDSEVAIAHPAFSQRVVHRANYTREPWGNPGDHGTAVAGIVASGDTANPGVAPGATI